MAFRVVIGLSQTAEWLMHGGQRIFDDTMSKVINPLVLDRAG